MPDMAELQIGERVATLESQVKDLSGYDSKIDKLMELMYEFKTSIINLKNEGMSKSECQVKHIDYEARMKEIQANFDAETKKIQIGFDAKFKETRKGQKQLFWSAVTATFVLFVWLIEQVLRITVHVGG